MLELALLIFIYECIERWFNSKLKKRLNAEQSSKGRIKIRRKVQRNRYILMALFLLFLLLTEIMNIYTAIKNPHDRYALKLCF